MIVINIALIILGILYGVGSVTNFKEWYYRHDYLAIALSVFTSILLVVVGVLNVVYWLRVLKCYRVDSQAEGASNQQPFAYCEHSIVVMLQIPNL